MGLDGHNSWSYFTSPKQERIQILDTRFSSASVLRWQSCGRSLDLDRDTHSTLGTGFQVLKWTQGRGPEEVVAP